MTVPAPAPRYEKRTSTLDSLPKTGSSLWSEIRVIGRDLLRRQEKIVLQNYHDDGSGKEPRYYQRQCRERRHRGHRQGSGPHPPGDGDGHREDLYRIPDHLAALEGRAGKNASCSSPTGTSWSTRRWSTTSGRSARRWRKLSTGSKTIERDDGTETSLEIATGPRQAPQPNRHRLRDLPRALPGDHRVPRSARSSFREFSPGFSTSSSLTSAIGAAQPRTPPGAKSWNTSASATQIGLTATPKETKYVSNIDYFGKAVLLVFAQAGHP